MTLAEKIKGILPDGEYLNVEKIGDYYELEYGQGDCPTTVSFAQLLQLSELFGTIKIDLDYYSHSDGCDTCGYGADKGHTIQIYSATKNVDELAKLVGSDLK